MAKSIVEIESEEDLSVIKTLGIINNIDVSTKEKQINLSIKLSAKIIKEATPESFKTLTNLLKSM